MRNSIGNRDIPLQCQHYVPASRPSNYASLFDDCALGDGAILPKLYRANYRQFKSVALMESCTQLRFVETPQSSLFFEPREPVALLPHTDETFFQPQTAFVAVGPRLLAAVRGWFSCMLLKPCTDLNMSVRPVSRNNVLGAFGARVNLTFA